MAEIETREGYLPFRDCSTWYRVTGSLSSGRLPLVVAHGGPGCTHDYVDAFKDITTIDGRPVIHYDQLGNGRSTRLPAKQIHPIFAVRNRVVGLVKKPQISFLAFINAGRQSLLLQRISVVETVLGDIYETALILCSNSWHVDFL